MAAPSHMFTNVMAKLDAGLLTYVDVIAGRVIGFIIPYAPVLFATAMCMYGYSVWRGVVQEPLRDGVFRFLRAAIIIGLLNLATYHAYIADFFLNLPDHLASVISGKPITSGLSFLDTLWDQQQSLADAFWQKGVSAGISGLGLLMIAIILYAVCLATTGGSALLLIVAKCGLYAWVGIGPLFVACAMFDATKQFTNSWLGQTITFSLLPMLTSAVIYQIQSLSMSYLGSPELVHAMTDPSVNQIFPLLFMCGASGLFLKQIPSFASSLGGGVAVSSLGVVGAAMKAAFGGVGSVKNAITGKTLDNMRSERKHRAMNKEWAKNNPGMTMRAYRAMTTPKNKVAKA